MRKTNTDQPGHPGDARVQEFLDMIAPSVVKFNTDHFICGNTFRCVWALREYTKPLFSIPTHQFLFNAGAIDEKFYIDTLQLEPSEFSLIRYPQRGVCLYKCGNERYNLMVTAPDYKARLFGKAGGR